MDRQVGKSRINGLKRHRDCSFDGMASVFAFIVVFGLVAPKGAMPTMGHDWSVKT
jgi:hypothetical protein